MHSKRVLFISHDANRAGSQLLLLQLIRLLNGQGIATHLLLCDGGELVDEFQAATSVTLLETPACSPIQSLTQKVLARLPLSRQSVDKSAEKRAARVRDELSRLNIGLVFVNSVANA